MCLTALAPSSGALAVRSFREQLRWDAHQRDRVWAPVRFQPLNLDRTDKLLAVKTKLDDGRIYIVILLVRLLRSRRLISCLYPRLCPTLKVLTLSGHTLAPLFACSYRLLPVRQRHHYHPRSILVRRKEKACNRRQGVQTRARLSTLRRR